MRSAKWLCSSGRQLPILAAGLERAPDPAGPPSASLLSSRVGLPDRGHLCHHANTLRRQVSAAPQLLAQRVRARRERFAAMSMSSLKIRGGEVFLIALPIRRPHHWVGHTARIGEGYVVLRLELENGIVGWGEAQVIGTWGGDHGTRYGETPKMTAIAIKEILLPAIVRPERHRDRAVARAHEPRPARLPLRQGGHRRRAPRCDRQDLRRPGLSTARRQGPRRRRDRAQHRDHGCRHRRARGGGGGGRGRHHHQGQDRRRGRARHRRWWRRCAQAIGSAGKIRVDANQGYRTWREAVRAITAMEKYDLVYAEQPVEGLRAMAEVSARINVPVMADESAWTAEDVLEIVRLNAAQMLSVYYTKPGGLRARQAAARGRRRGGAAVRHQRLGRDGHRRRRRSASRGVVARNRAARHDPGDFDGRDDRDQGRGSQVSRRPDQDAVPLRQGHASTCPDGPGLGIEVDEAKIAKYRIG